MRTCLQESVQISAKEIDTPLKRVVWRFRVPVSVAQKGNGVKDTSLTLGYECVADEAEFFELFLVMQDDVGEGPHDHVDNVLWKFWDGHTVELVSLKS